MRKIAIFKEPFVICYFLILTLYFTHPLISNLTTKIIGVNDELLITWFLNWDIHAITTNIGSFFDANIFYPFKNTLAYSEIMLPSAILALPFVALFKEPILAFNINFLFGFWATGYFTYLLIRWLVKSRSTAVAIGTLFSFSTIHLNYLGHLQMFVISFIPLSLLFLLRFLKTQKTSELFFFLLFSIIQGLNNFLTFYFLALISIVFLLDHLLIRRERLDKIKKKSVVLLFSMSLLIVWPFFNAYSRVSKDFRYQRPIQDAIHFSLQPEDLLYPSDMTRLAPILLDNFGLKVKDSNTKTTPGYLGFAFFVLGLLVILWAIKSLRKRHDLIPYLIILASSLLLSLGPFFHLFRKTIHSPFPIPLPYAVFYYLVPGFSGFRTPSRWIILLAFFLAILIGFMLKAWIKRRGKKTNLLVVCSLCVLVIIEFNFPLKYFDLPTKDNFPPVYKWLATKAQKEAILELPMYNWDMSPYATNESKREFYSTIHFHRTVNGFSGFSPSEWEEQTRFFMVNFPDQNTIGTLKKLKVKYVIVHKNEYEILNQDNFKIYGKKPKKVSQILNYLEQGNDMRIVQKFGDDLVFELL